MLDGTVDFESIWLREIAPVDLPNRRGEGTSSVGIVERGQWGELGSQHRHFVKRQEAFYCRPAWNAFRPTPTLRRELRFIERARAFGIAVPTVAHYAEGSRGRAVLVLEEVEGVVDLQQAALGLSVQSRRGLFEDVGKTLAKLHARRILHGAIYPKHVLVEVVAPSRVWLIDFEKARRVVSRSRAAQQDLDRLFRHAPFMTDADVDAVLTGYDERVFRRVHRAAERFYTQIAAAQSKR